MSASSITREAANKAIIRRIFEECFNQGNLSLCNEVASPRLVGPHGAGPEGLRATIQFVRGQFGSPRFTIEDIIAEGDTVAVRWSMSGTHSGPLFGTTPSGKPLVNRANVFYRFEDGKVVQTWLQSDQVGLLEQLGALPPGLNVPRPPAPAASP